MGSGTFAMMLYDYRAGRPICRKVLKIIFWEVPSANWLYCSYLLPKQALATHMGKHNKTLRQIGRPALYYMIKTFLSALYKGTYSRARL